MLSGKFVLRIDPQLHEALRLEAQSHGMSLNSWIVNRLGSERDSRGPVLDLIHGLFSADLLAVVQFGSSIRNEARPSSDVDLLLVLRDEREIDKSLYHLWEKGVPRKFDRFSPQFCHLPKGSIYSSLWLEVALEGEVLYDPQGVAAKTLRRIREVIAAGEYTRKISHGHPYWVRRSQADAE